MDARRPEVVGRVIYTTHSSGKNAMWKRLRGKLLAQREWFTHYITTEEKLVADPINPAPKTTQKRQKPAQPKTKPVDGQNGDTAVTTISGWVWSGLLNANGTTAIITAESGIANLRTGPGKASNPVPLGWLATGTQVEITGPLETNFRYYPVRVKQDDLNQY